MLKLWDISNKEPKTILPGRLFAEYVHSFLFVFALTSCNTKIHVP